MAELLDTVRATLARMRDFAGAIRSGDKPGAGGAITDEGS